MSDSPDFNIENYSLEDLIEFNRGTLLTNPRKY